MARTVDDLEQGLAADEWLRPGDVARVLDISKSAVIRMLNAEPPQIRYRYKPGTGRHRECHPEDVRRELVARRQVHGDQ
ncbi:hypothetical protein ACGFIP_32365 [Micromonospora zamorensis]|uniref:hypothetical protein n=1 Tax=Micromonospora zamorensis TaxID=709883 RepID=UPI0037139A66